MLGPETTPSIAAIGWVGRHAVRSERPLRQQAVVARSTIVGVNQALAFERTKISHFSTQHNTEFLVLGGHMFICVSLSVSTGRLAC